MHPLALYGPAREAVGQAVRYTGHGWENETLEEARYDAGQSLPKTSAKGRRELRQTFSLFAWGDQVAYAASDPLRLDVPYRARWRASGDLVGLEAQARQYGPTAACSIFEREGAEPSQALPALPPPPRSLTKKLPGGKIWAGVGLLLGQVARFGKSSYTSCSVGQVARFGKSSYTSCSVGQVARFDKSSYKLQRGSSCSI